MKLLIFTIIITLSVLFKSENIPITQFISSPIVCPSNQCGASLCSQLNGFCLNDIDCLCNKGFTSTGSDTKCCYKQKKQIDAFLLELFISFGAGHFYIGRVDLGGAKVAVFLFLIMINLFMKIGGNYLIKNSKLFKILRYAFIITGVLCYLVWQIVDFYYYGMNMYLDGNGVGLVEW